MGESLNYSTCTTDTNQRGLDFFLVVKFYLVLSKYQAFIHRHIHLNSSWAWATDLLYAEQPVIWPQGGLPVTLFKFNIPNYIKVPCEITLKNQVLRYGINWLLLTYLQCMFLRVQISSYILRSIPEWWLFWYHTDTPTDDITDSAVTSLTVI